jgi:adenosylhomocysteine nucleosidase
LPKIVVTFAVRSEFAAWRRMSGFEPVNRGDDAIYLMRTGDAEVYAVITGIGMRSVRSDLQRLLAESVDLCIASGLAGSLTKQYRAGSILVAKAVRTSGPDRAIKSDKSLVRVANQCGAASVDFFFTSDVVMNSQAEKLRLREIADAVEMESFQIFSQAAKHGVPVVAVRAISDAADTNLPIDFNRIVDNRGQISWRFAFEEIAKAPTRLPQLIRFGFESTRAARNLAYFLDRYIKFLIGGAELQFLVARTEAK